VIPGLILVAIGLLWLLAELGVLPLSLADLWRLWPLILVGFGLELLLGSTPRGRRLAAAIFAALLAAALFWLAWPGSAGRGAFIRETYSVPLETGLERVRLRVNVPVARLDLARLPQPDTAVFRADLERLPRQRIVFTRKRRGDRLDIEIASRGRHLRFRGTSPIWKLRLHPAPTYDLWLKTGVGAGRLDLRGLRLQTVVVEAGVGSLEVYLSEQGGYEARIEGGVGALTVYVPPALPVNLQVERGVGRVEIAGLDDLAAVNPTLEPVRLVIESGVGQVTVRRLEP